MNKNIEFTANTEIGPLYRAKLNKDLFKGIGFGFKFTLDRFDEIMTPGNEEEDLSEYVIE